MACKYKYNNNWYSKEELQTLLYKERGIDKYGKLVKPEITLKNSKQVFSVYDEYGDPDLVDDIIIETFNTFEEAQKFADLKNSDEGYTDSYGGRYKVVKEKRGGIQPTQTKENTTSIESVKDKTLGIIKTQRNIEREELLNQGYKELDYGELYKPKEYTEQALINTKIAKLKEVAKKYPRSLITSKVINNSQSSERQYQKPGIQSNPIDVKDTGATRDTDLENNVWNDVSNEDNALISKQLEHIEVTRNQKKTTEKVMLFSNDLAGSTDENYILKNNTVLTRASSIIAEDPKFKFEGEDFDEEKYEINRKWGNQIDDILRAVLLYRFDSEQESKVLEEIKKQKAKRNEESVMSDAVVLKLISEFNKFAKRNSDKVLVPQVFLYNEESKIGGTADIVMIDKYGLVQVVDLKSSLYPVGWNGKFFESYDKQGEDGKTYRNNYAKEFGDRGSKKQRHEAQTSMYIGMMLARGINYNESTPIQILPVHISQLEEYSGETIEDVIVERDDAPMDLNNDYLSKVSVDDKHNERVLNSYETEFEQNKNKLTVFIKNEIELLRRIKSKQSYYRIKELEEMLKKLDDASVADSSKISKYIIDLHKTFISGDFALSKQIKSLVRQIKNGKIEDSEKAIKELIAYKEKIALFTPLINDLENFYRDISEDNVNEDNPDSMLYKLGELIDVFREMDEKYYKKTINPLIAQRFGQFASSEKSNKQVEQRVKRLNEKLSTLKIELEKAKQKEDSISKLVRLKYLNYRIESIEGDIYKLENTAIITEESILKQLNEGSYEDISFFQKVALAPQSSSNVFIAGTAKIIDEIFDNIRMAMIEVQEEIHKAFEEFASSNTSKNKNNPKEFNEGLYETITTGYIENKQLTTVEDLALIQRTDVTKYNKERQKFLETIKNLEGREYWEEYNKWYSQNTETLSMKDEIVDGQVIRDGIESIIKDKKEDVKNSIITQKQYKLWFDNAFNTKKEDGKIVITGARFDTKEGRQLRRPSSDKYTNSKWLELQKDASKLKYYNKLLVTYFKSQENYPTRKSHEHKFILPYITKSDLNRVSENGLKDTGKEKVKRLVEQSEDEKKKVYGESKLKVIPILYNDRIDPNDVSLDLAQSILKYDQASKEFKARTEIEPVMKSLLFSVSENKPIKTDSKGRMIITKFAEELNLPGLDKYVKESESNIEALLKYYIDNVVYGISREKTVYGGVDMHNAVDKLSGIISTTSLGLPFGLFSNVANWLQGEAQTVIEGHSKQFFDNKTYLWAEKEYLSLTKDFIKDMTAPIKTTKIGQMIELFDPFIGEFKDKYGHNISKDAMRVALTSSPRFFFQNLGEHHVQIKTMLAFLKSTKIKDKNGNETSLYDAYTTNKEGKLMLKDGIDLSQLGNLSQNRMLPLSVKNKMNSVLRKTHGNYSNMTAPMMRKYWYGRVIEFMRRFFATSVEKRWRQTRYNFEEEGLTEGYMRTFWRLFITEFKELYNVGFGFATGKESNLTDLEIANLRRNAMDMAFVAVTGLLVYILTAMMKNADTPEEKDRIALFLAPVMRLNAELAAFGQIGDINRGLGLMPDVNDIKRNITNPTVMVGYITKSIQFIEQIPKDISSMIITGDIQRYQKDTGFWEKGDSKLMAKFLALFGASPSKMDLTESVKSLQMIQNK